MKVSGVYQIKNKINGKIYIGSSHNIHQRLNQHKSEYRKNKHHNRHLSRAFNKYGISNFEFSILKETPNQKEIILAEEQKFMDLYKSYKSKYGYNINPKAESSLGVKRSPEFIKKMIEGQKGKRQPRIHVEKRKQALRKILKIRGSEIIKKRIKSSCQIAKDLGTYDTTILNWIHRFNIDIK